MTKEKQQNDAIGFLDGFFKRIRRCRVGNFGARQGYVVGCVEEETLQEIEEKIRTELERSQRMREALEEIVGYEGNQHTTRMAEQALSDAPKESE